MASLFDKLESEAFRKGLQARSKEANAWFANNVKKLGKIGPGKMLGDDRLRKQAGASPGDMVMYTYNPKLKQTLPSYDTFPLTIVVGPAPGGFYELNLHYLPPTLRARMLDGLMDITNNKSYDDTTKFQVRYNTLKRASSLKYYKPCFKHYLNEHVKSRFAYVPPPEWEIATFLPTADFQKSGRSTVYKDSRKMI